MFKSARKLAGLSIEGAAFQLNIGSRTLVNYENGHTLTPPDVVLNMSETYQQPRLAAKYCAEQCPIGQKYAHSVPEKDLATAVLGLIKEYNDVKKIRDRLIEISADGVIDEDERPDLEVILQELGELELAIETLKWWAMSELKTQRNRKPAPAMVAEERVVYGQKNRAVL
ncbi:helix-turn-helix domain-containing protein [Desulfoscipio geothermicus]|uniref:Helix-turn-helix n=1 Tax=Desulfoscipio geothermicus DSM 3669 TaxID=1121426 RepID=A0A1I6ECC1_9FIRM|nr:helix-turn-helix domain-containing protein [Desulfoscipio geothermicus]SFR15390.1 Helix-turn-helix [Desulfoscipio geothermicus DSM 3669]